MWYGLWSWSPGLIQYSHRPLFIMLYIDALVTLCAKFLMAVYPTMAVCIQRNRFCRIRLVVEIELRVLTSVMRIIVLKS